METLPLTTNECPALTLDRSSRSRSFRSSHSHSFLSLVSLSIAHLAHSSRSRSRSQSLVQHSLTIAIVGVAELGFKPSSPPPPTLSSSPSLPHRLSLAGTIDLKNSCPICKKEVRISGCQDLIPLITV
ncbi:hypothetical protein Syun_025418 [Stephania yunnanensis]|uniref:Uncharacterized protein n=1 Tax=Stephania yunnanensis TaxID=152371 RepID=A0AAP0EX70_9MAGN